jgi:hypothetical protein
MGLYAPFEKNEKFGNFAEKSFSSTYTKSYNGGLRSELDEV